MRAAVARAFGEPLRIEAVDIDDPGEGEIAVDVAACAICHSDIIFADGGWGGTLPAIYGHEAAGLSARRILDEIAFVHATISDDAVERGMNLAVVRQDSGAAQLVPGDLNQDFLHFEIGTRGGQL